MRVPTEKELADRRENPEDSTIPPDTEPIPVFIPVSQEDEDVREYQERLARYHLEFLLLAKYEGYQVDLPEEIEPPVQEEEFLLVVDLNQEPSLLECKLKAFCDHVREQARYARQGYKERMGAMATQFLAEYSRDARGTIKRLDSKQLKLLDNILTAYKLGLESKDDYSVAVDMKLVSDTPSDNEWTSAKRKVSRWREKAQLLIKAAAEGRFVEETSIPIRK